MYFPVVRFLTEKQEWITQELDIGQYPALEEGKKIRLIYNQENPEEVEINSIFRLENLPPLLPYSLCWNRPNFIQYRFK